MKGLGLYWGTYLFINGSTFASLQGGTYNSQNLCPINYSLNAGYTEKLSDIMEDIKPVIMYSLAKQSKAQTDIGVHLSDKNGICSLH